MARSDYIDSIRPLLFCGNNKDIPGRTLKRWHVLHSAESAILPSGIPVPVNDNDRETGNQKKSQGRSSVGAPVLTHSEAIIVPSARPCNVSRCQRQRPWWLTSGI